MWAGGGPPTLLFWKMALDVVGSFHFHMNFRIGLSFSTEILVGLWLSWRWVYRWIRRELLAWSESSRLQAPLSRRLIRTLSVLWVVGAGATHVFPNMWSQVLCCLRLLQIGRKSSFSSFVLLIQILPVDLYTLSLWCFSHCGSRLGSDVLKQLTDHSSSVFCCCCC